MQELRGSFLGQARSARFLITGEASLAGVLTTDVRVKSIFELVYAVEHLV